MSLVFTRKLSQYPWFFLLLPVFFVFHGFVANQPFVLFRDCWGILGIYLVADLMIFLLSRYLLKTTEKAALLAFFILSYYFFFGALHDELRKYSTFLSRYAVLLPAFVLLPTALALYLKKRRRPFSRLTFFLNTLLLLYILIDGGTLAWKAGWSDRTRLSASPFTTRLANRPGCDTCPRPDIYLLVFDEYCANRTLKDVYHYDNSSLDSFLRKEEFHLQSLSRSNYSITPFSMASMLNLSYLPDIPHPMALKPADYMDMLRPISRNEVVNYLLSKGYSVVNNSPFDLPGHPCLIDQPFIPVRTKLITSGTLADYVVRDLGSWVEDHLHDPDRVLQTTINQISFMNNSFLNWTIEESAHRSDSPRFIYMHVMMPHFPYLFDGLYRERKPVEIDSNAGNPHPDHYLGYLPYTNSRIRQLITAIKNNSGGKAIILFMSDHGFRYSPDRKVSPLFFNNQNAVYFPDGDYSMLYDSITNVNQFRVVFNKLFRLNLPLLKDSVIFLQERL